MARDDIKDVLDSWINWLNEQPDEKGVDGELNKMDESGYTPLHYAAKFNRFNILRCLIISLGAGMQRQ